MNIDFLRYKNIFEKIRNNSISYSINIDSDGSIYGVIFFNDKNCDFLFWEVEEFKDAIIDEYAITTTDDKGEIYIVFAFKIQNNYRKRDFIESVANVFGFTQKKYI
ncbi:hypothetical protein [Photobacterium leiognathi]|uniref:hypothetical protein n=1 Tax=Photobacterium leiognathi TaxID=553611 RepID=UPI0029828DD9|nr:hypothetical protein [Photobacterium leiognathi]